jgi:hypothetical protein
MAARYLRTHLPEPDSIPWIPYILGVGGALICLMFAADALMPKAPERPYHEIDKTVLRVHPPTQPPTLASTTVIPGLAIRKTASR